jgi:hypothetical protein
MEKWRSLLSQIKFTGTEYPTFTDAEIEAFEQKTGISLPQDYKDFCKVFGAGSFGTEYQGEEYHIYSLDQDFSEERLGFLLEHWQGELEHSLEMISEYNSKSVLEPSAIENLIELLRQAFTFGGYLGLYFVWDLNSYDIWIVSIDYLDSYNLGSDFFEFVHDFCLGKSLHKYDCMSEWMRPWSHCDTSNQEIGFKRFPC